MATLKCQLCGKEFDETLEACPDCGCPREIIQKADSVLGRLEEENLLKRTAQGTVLFGKYEQGNGVEPIEWQILMPYDNALFMISRKILDCKPYHDEKVASVSWENCFLRRWLEQTFAVAAFTEAELKVLLPVELIPDCNDGSLQYGTSAIGKPVFDTLFPLSYTEARGTLSDMTINSEYTAFAKAQAQAKDDEPGFWWTRTPGFNHSYAMSFATDGSINSYGFEVTTPVGVRPALFINLNYFEK